MTSPPTPIPDPSRPDHPGEGNRRPPSMPESGVILAETVEPVGGSSRRRWWIIFGVIAIVLIVLAVRESPHEVARWYAAAAEESHLHGDEPAARAALEKAFRWHPDSLEFLAIRCSWNWEAERYEEALKDAEKMIALAPTEPVGYMHRSLIYQHMGKHREAVEDYTRIAKMMSGRDQFLNNLAYARAVGGFELQKGLEEIQQAIENAGHHPSYLDTRGFLLHRLGENEKARQDLDVAVRNVEAQLSDAKGGPVPGEPAAAESVASEPAPGRQVGGRYPEFYIRQQLAYKSSARNVAVIRYHRALVLQALGADEQAAEDLDRVRELGFTPGPDLF